MAKTECPGIFEWSAFGASYMDTMCASAMDWGKNDYPGAYLQDLDSDYGSEDVPCPFCMTEAFLEYCGIGAENEFVWSKDRKPIQGAEVFPEDGEVLTFYAEHPERGMEKVIISQKEEEPNE